MVDLVKQPIPSVDDRACQLDLERFRHGFGWKPPLDKGKYDITEAIGLSFAAESEYPLDRGGLRRGPNDESQSAKPVHGPRYTGHGSVVLGHHLRAAIIQGD